MYTARQFGIDRKEGLLKTFMSNDWMHGVLVNYNVDHKVRSIARVLLGAEILSTSVALVNYTSKDVSICWISIKPVNSNIKRCNWKWLMREKKIRSIPSLWRCFSNNLYLILNQYLYSCRTKPWLFSPSTCYYTQWFVWAMQRWIKKTCFPDLLCHM